MPVWHALTEPYRRDGRLELVGVVQEQHPERAELFALWQGFDWPLLWDPFNLTGSHVVPRVFLLDEQGLVLAIGPRPEQLAALLDAPVTDADAADARAEPGAAETSRGASDSDADTAHTATRGGTATDAGGDDPWLAAFDAPHVSPDGRLRLPDEATAPRGSLAAQAWDALAALLFEGAWLFDADTFDLGVERLQRYVEAHPDDAAMRFRLGVARRLRLDRGDGRAGDFQGAVDAWSAALAQRPEQYIWRRRLQQYGPRLDQPYPFYTWVEQARAELADRGMLAPHVSGLTQAEARSEPLDDAPDVAPDPAGTYPRDSEGWVRADSAVVFHTGDERPVARVHLTLRPDESRDVHWNNEAGPTLVWLDAAPAGWTLERRGFAVGDDTSPVSLETRRVDFELGLPDGAASGTLTGYALLQVCEGDAGTCMALRHDLRIEIRP